MKDFKQIVKSRKIHTEYRMFKGWGLARVELRFDDQCGNGHNSFGITCDSKSQGAGAFCGCMHEEIVKAFPEYADLIKWHLTSTDGPMHYIANTVYWAEQGNLEYARSTAVAPNATIEQLSDKQWLLDRLPALMTEFEKAMLKTFADSE